MIKGAESVNLLEPPDYLRVIRTRANLQKAKLRLTKKRRALTRKLTTEMCISRTSPRRILRKNLDYFPYKKVKQPKLTKLQKKKTVKFANWISNHYIKDETRRWFFSDENFFDLNEVYDSQNDRA